VEGRAEFPGVAQEYRNHLARLDAGGGETARERLDDFSVLGIGETASTRTVYDRGLLRISTAGVEYQVMEKEVLRICVELRAQHAGRDCSGKPGDSEWEKGVLT
jgi:hypothetical protein